MPYYCLLYTSFSMKKVAFKSGLLIDGTGAEPVANSLVLTEDDKITYAGADREIGPDYEVVDIAGKTIMPGLIDSHLHFSGNLTDDDSDWVLEDVVQKTVVAVQQAHECLENGLDVYKRQVTCREVIMAKRIYVADDELHIRTLIQTFLANEGYEVETFEDGNSLFEAFHASCPDLIILDVMMPGMDGFALCTAIRRESRVPIIIVSAKDAPMDRVTGITLGSDDYMVKPFLPLELVARVKALFRRAGYIRQDAGETLVCANLSLDPRSRCMTVDGAHRCV